METFIKILEEIVKIDGVVNRNDDLETIIATLRSVTKNLLGFYLAPYLLI